MASTKFATETKTLTTCMRRFTKYEKQHKPGLPMKTILGTKIQRVPKQEGQLQCHCYHFVHDVILKHEILF
jgi:hypothetical protein